MSSRARGFQEVQPPAVPQTVAGEGGQSRLRRADALNAFAGERWATAPGKRALPLRVYGAPSVEQTEALEAHLSATALLSSMLGHEAKPGREESVQSPEQQGRRPQTQGTLPEGDPAAAPPEDVRPAVCISYLRRCCKVYI
jgi:hypothetical protein